MRADIVDLAGARVALYFPGDRTRVNALVVDLFDAIETREFPEPTPPAKESGWKKRFSGYGATHHRVQLAVEPHHPYAGARIEVQVASVLMHAWSEVEHDLIYKPLSGDLSEEEYAILDELNGVVIAGEIALERLQVAGERRLIASKQPFRSLYDVATMLIEHARKHLSKALDDTMLGRTDLLTELLVDLKLNNPEELRPFLDALDPDVERRPLSDQVIERIITGRPERADAYQRLQRGAASEVTQRDRALGAFVRRWAILEHVLSAAPVAVSSPSRTPTMFGLIRTAQTLLGGAASDLDRLRQRRNQMIHRGSTRDALDIQRDADAVLELIRALSTCLDPDVSAAATEALRSHGMEPMPND